MKDQLVEAGRARAASVGWPDAYAFTKALGEQALTESKGDVPVSIVRPSIIESAWAEPRPGWIRGFRMAEPVIISYARGLLREFPGVPEGTVDVIPVDMVVAAIIAVAAAGPERAPAITQVASGGINPLKYRTLVDNVSAGSPQHPLYDNEGQPIVVPEWRFPGRGRVQAQLTRAKADHHARREGCCRRSRCAASRPSSSATLETQADRGRAGPRVRRAVRPLHRVRGDLPGRQPDGAVGRRSTPPTSSSSPSIPRSDRLADYIHEIHLPSIVEHARVKIDARQVRSTDRMVRLRKQVLDPERHVAAFDLENTLIASNVVESYSWLATRRLERAGAAPLRAAHPRRGARACSSSIGATAPTSSATSIDATRTHPSTRSTRTPRELLTQLILTKSFPAGLRRVREHRAAGHRTVLITGALDFAVAGSAAAVRRDRRRRDERRGRTGRTRAR